MIMKRAPSGGMIYERVASGTKNGPNENKRPKKEAYQGKVPKRVIRETVVSQKGVPSENGLSRDTRVRIRVSKFSNVN